MKKKIAKIEEMKENLRVMIEANKKRKREFIIDLVVHMYNKCCQEVHFRFTRTFFWYTQRLCFVAIWQVDFANISAAFLTAFPVVAKQFSDLTLCIDCWRVIIYCMKGYTKPFSQKTYVCWNVGP